MEYSPAQLRSARRFAWAVLGFVTSAMALLAWFPDLFLVDGTGAVTPFQAGAGWRPVPAGVVHLLTLGGLLGAYYPLQGALWVRLYGRSPVGGARMDTAILLFQVGGMVLFAAGLLARSSLIAYLGGHYLIPTGIALGVLQGALTAARRAPGHPRHLAAHLPAVGLLVALSLGALLVMDAHRGLYGIYLPSTILVHLLSGVFLFFMPFSLLAEGVLEPDRRGGAPAPAGRVAPSWAVFPLAAMAGLGVMVTALGMADPSGRPALPAGLALLGGLCVWWGLPAQLGEKTSPDGGRAFLPWRAPWAFLGLWLLYAAIRDWRGAEGEETLLLAWVGILLFLFGVALPWTMVGLEKAFFQSGAGGKSGEPTVWMLMPYWSCAALVAGGEALGAAWPTRIGAWVWLGLLGWQGWRWARRAVTFTKGW